MYNVYYMNIMYIYTAHTAKKSGIAQLHRRRVTFDNLRRGVIHVIEVSNRTAFTYIIYTCAREESEVSVTKS